MKIGKIFSFIVITPLIILLMLKTVAFYEFDTKQRYIKNLLDNAAYQVRITGCFDHDDFSALKSELSKLAQLDAESLKTYYASSLEGGFEKNSSTYYLGTELQKGEFFSIEFSSMDVSNLSRLQNLGVSVDESKNLRYGGKTLISVEHYDG